MEITNEKAGDCYVVSVTGSLDATTAGEFEGQCDTLLSTDEQKVLLDMSKVDYISSAGLRSILVLAKSLKVKGGDLHFCGLLGEVADVFRMSGFTSMFQVFETREQAING